MADYLLAHLQQCVHPLPLALYNQSGIYFLHHGAVVVYVGQAANMKRRIGHHLAEGYKVFDGMSCMPLPVEKLDQFERYFIARLVPKYNQCHVAAQVRSMSSQGWQKDSITRVVGLAPRLPTDQAAHFLGVSVDVINRWVALGMPYETARRPRSKARIRLYSLDELLCARTAFGEVQRNPFRAE